MKVRKLAVALALAGGLGSGVAQALGLGEIELQSYLNEPLNAEIDLRKSTGVAPNDVFVNIAPQSAYDRVGISRSYFLTKLNFQVTTAPDGNLVVNVTSREPLREPYLNFLLEVTWPNGRLMREYAVLVDPPVYAEDSGLQEQVAAPATQQVTRQPQVSQAEATQPTRTRTATTSRSSGSRTLGPTNSADTLWTIAAQIRPNDSVSMQQTMLALQDLNPDSFIDGNINRLKRGEILRVPDLDQIRSRSREEANREVAVQNRAFSSPKPAVDATGTESRTASTAPGSSGGDQLRLVTADEVESRDANEGGSAGGDSDVAGGVDAGQAVAMEQLESARRENEELTGRVDDLQDQVQTLQRLLELKNSQLAEMQNAEAEQPAEGAESLEALPADGGSDAAMPEQGEMASDSTDGSAMTEGDMAADEGDTADQTAADPDMAASEDTSADTSGSASDETMTDSSEQAMADDEAKAADSSKVEMAESGSTAAEKDSEASSDGAAPTPAKPAEKPFPGNIIDAISNNYLYQIGLGGGLIVLLLALLALARRNANREKAFYDQLNGESEEASDSFDLSFDEEDEGGAAKEDDAISEADAYIAYGRNDQAAQVLETAISREPSRTDLRLKLLGVYADSQDRNSFDKQFGEIEALDDEDALEEAKGLREKLEEAESMPSIDDLESQLLTGGSDSSAEAERDEDSSEEIDFSTDFGDSESEDSEKDEGVDFSSDFEDMDLELPESDETSSEPDKSADESEVDSSDGAIEYDFSGFEDAETESPELDAEDTEVEAEANEDFNFSLDEESSDSDESSKDDDLNIDFDTSDLGLEDKEEVGASDEDSADEELSIDLPEDASAQTEDDSSDALDESFLDDLDAELDKVAGDEASVDESDSGELDDLELDVSDEDLALMEEFSESDDDTVEPDKTEDSSLEDELGLEDALSGESPADPEQEVEAAEKVDELPVEDDSIPPVAKPSGSGAASSGADIDESDLGDDDDFDFLAGTDEAATKLDLARAYVEMGDVDGARDILEEVALEGNDEQKAEAQDLLKNLS